MDDFLTTLTCEEYYYYDEDWDDYDHSIRNVAPYKPTFTEDDTNEF